MARTLERAQADKLIRAAQAVLDGNWTGAFTKPTPRLYPHQWSWDSAFIAIGTVHYDQARAEQELFTLFDAQWANGLVPHIVFHDADADYYPGPEVWQIERNPHAPSHVQTTGLVQPPVHATAARRVGRMGCNPASALAFLESMYPSLRAWHDYLYAERDPADEGLVAIRHPWESGMDNAPTWDGPLARMPVEKAHLPEIQRVDRTLVNAADRPTDEAYERFLYLIQVAADAAYDEARLARICPFYVQDVLFNSLLCRAERDLGQIARTLGRGAEATEHEARADRTAESIDAKLWDESTGIYLDYDLRAEAPIDAHAAAGFAPVFAGIPSQSQLTQIYAYMNSACFCQIDQDCFAVPSFQRHGEGYSPRRYWRGPVWINVNWLLYRGLRAYGVNDYADWLRRAIVDLPWRCGFYEYFDPTEGRGHGADRFSWTAALLLDVLSDEWPIPSNGTEKEEDAA